MPPAARFEGLTQTIARVNNIESALAAIAQAQAQTSTSIVQLTASVAALVQHDGIANALPPAPPPAPPPQIYAAIAAAPAPAGGAAVAPVSEAAMDGTSAGASAQAEAPAAAPSWHGSMTPMSTGGPSPTGAAPSAEMDLNNDSMPVPDAPVSRRTRLSLALASVLPAASGTTQGTAEGPATWSATARHVMWADEHEWDDDEYYATTDDEFDDSHYVLFDDDDGGGAIGDDDDTSQHADESSGEYEARLNGIIPPAAHFCCRPVFS